MPSKGGLPRRRESLGGWTPPREARAPNATRAPRATIPAMARVFVTRRLPGTALERLAAEHEVEVWEGAMPPSAQELRAKVADAEGLLSLLTDRIDADLL